MKERPRVVQLVRGLSSEGHIAGGERYAVELAVRLRDYGFEPLVCGLWRFGTPSEEHFAQLLRQSGIDLALLLPYPEGGLGRAIPSVCKRAASLFREWRVHLLHTHSMTSDLVAAMLRATGQFRGPAVRTVHNYDFSAMLGCIIGPLAATLNACVYPAVFTAETAVSREYVAHLDRRPLARLLGRHAVWLSNAIDLDRFAERSPGYVQKTLGLPEDTPVVGLVGKLTAQKGPDVFLEAAASVAARDPRVHFALIGDGPLAQDLRQRAAETPLRGRAHLLGARTDVDPLISSLTVLISASRWEGLPTVVLEAMAAGVPVVGTDIAGTRELVEHGHTGLLVPSGDPVALADAILSVLNSEELRHSVVAQAGQRIAQFSFEAILPRVTHVYRSALGRAHEPRNACLTRRWY